MEPSPHFDPAAKSAPAATAHPPGALSVLMIDVEPAHADLIALWLAGEGWRLRRHTQGDGPVQLVLIEIAFPRPRDREWIDALSHVWPGAPIVVLSPTFVGGLPAQGDVARQLGATAVLATPLARERLLAVVRGVLGPAP